MFEISSWIQLAATGWIWLKLPLIDWSESLS